MERTDEINNNITLKSRKHGLTFGTDAWLLYAWIPSSGRKLKAADLGAGTGVISLLILKHGKAETVHAFEIQDTYADLIRENAKNNGVSGRLTVCCADVRNISEKDTDGRCDLVFMNPPYMSPDSGLQSRHTEMNIARREIFGTIGDFCQAAARLLKSGGALYTVYRPDRLPELYAAMRGAGIEPKRQTTVYPDARSRPCLVLCEGRLGGSAGLFVTRPLFLFEDRLASPPVQTEEARSIYEKGETDESYRTP